MKENIQMPCGNELCLWILDFFGSRWSYINLVITRPTPRLFQIKCAAVSSDECFQNGILPFNEEIWKRQTKLCEKLPVIWTSLGLTWGQLWTQKKNNPSKHPHSEQHHLTLKRSKYGLTEKHFSMLQGSSKKDTSDHKALTSDSNHPTCFCKFP